MLRTPRSEISVQGTASCNEIAAVDVDDDREFLAVAFLVLRNKRRDGQALITSLIRILKASKQPHPSYEFNFMRFASIGNRKLSL